MHVWGNTILIKPSNNRECHWTKEYMCVCIFFWMGFWSPELPLCKKGKKDYNEKFKHCLPHFCQKRNVHADKRNQHLHALANLTESNQLTCSYIKGINQYRYTYVEQLNFLEERIVICLQAIVFNLFFGRWFLISTKSIHLDHRSSSIENALIFLVCFLQLPVK